MWTVPTWLEYNNSKAAQRYVGLLSIYPAGLSRKEEFPSSRKAAEQEYGVVSNQRTRNKAEPRTRGVCISFWPLHVPPLVSYAARLPAATFQTKVSRKQRQRMRRDCTAPTTREAVRDKEQGGNTHARCVTTAPIDRGIVIGPRVHLNTGLRATSTMLPCAPTLSAGYVFAPRYYAVAPS